MPINHPEVAMPLREAPEKSSRLTIPRISYAVGLSFFVLIAAHDADAPESNDAPAAAVEKDDIVRTDWYIGSGKDRPEYLMIVRDGHMRSISRDLYEDEEWESYAEFASAMQDMGIANLKVWTNDNTESEGVITIYVIFESGEAFDASENIVEFGQDVAAQRDVFGSNPEDWQGEASRTSNNQKIIVMHRMK